jgi:hypothetical protein
MIRVPVSFPVFLAESARAYQDRSQSLDDPIVTSAG